MVTATEQATKAAVGRPTTLEAWRAAHPDVTDRELFGATTVLWLAVPEELQAAVLTALANPADVAAPSKMAAFLCGGRMFLQGPPPSVPQGPIGP